MLVRDTTRPPDSRELEWQLKQLQHDHPLSFDMDRRMGSSQGQDNWTILSGEGQYQIAATAASIPIAPGDVVVAHRGEVHGFYNNGSEPLVFVSVVAPAASGYEPL